MYNDGTASFANSTLSGNTATTGLEAGGLYNDGAASFINSTLSSNTVGIVSVGSGTVTLTNSTLSGNSGLGVAKGSGSPTVTVTNTIIADGCSGTPSDGGGNLDGGATCGFTAATSKSNATLNLGPLANNGGPTQTILPGTGSNAARRGTRAEDDR